MVWALRFWLKLQTLFRSKRSGERLHDEMQFHLDQQIDENRAAGMSRQEARYAAMRTFGNPTYFKEETRNTWGWRWLEQIAQDLRYAGRSLRRTPAFVVTVTATIALGIGVNAALFTVFDAHYLRPIEVRDPHSLYEIFWTDRAGDSQEFSPLQFKEFLAQNPAFSEAIAFRRVGARLNGKHLSGIAVSGNYFSMLGVRAALGRALLPADAEKPGDTPFVVLSHAIWQTQFAADPKIAGRKIFLHRHPFEVVGVAPREFIGLGSRPTDFWVPLTMASFFQTLVPALPANQVPEANLAIVGRLRPGYTIRPSETGVLLWVQRFTASLSTPEQAVAISTISRATRMPLRPKNLAAFSLVIAAFAVILIIACANVSCMMLARASARQREIGVRLSLGASRGRLARQLLTEGILVVLPSAGAGVLLSQLIIRSAIWVLATTLPAEIGGFLSRIPSLAPDIRVLAFSLCAALLAALLCGLAPALQAAHTSLIQASRGDFGSNWRPSQVRNALLAGQIVVCVVMLTTAGMLLRGIAGVQDFNAALSARNVIQVSVQENSRQMVLNRVARDPTVETVAAAMQAPVDRKPTAVVKPAGSPSLMTILANRVSPDYFAVFGLPILAGRNFTAQEARSSAPVALVSETAVAELWPNQQLLGRSLELTDDRNAATEFRHNQTVTVIGVVRDELSRWIANGESKAIVYFPISAQSAGTQLFLSVHGDADATRDALDADLSAIDADAIEDIQVLQIRQWVSEEAYSLRVMYWLCATLGILALLLTLAGVYGVVSYATSQRIKEIGVRMALGATTRAVTRLFVLHSARLAIVGGAIGCLLAAGIGKLLSASLVTIDAFDLWAYAGGLFVVWLACGLAAYMPARRAARVDPLITLRYE